MKQLLLILTFTLFLFGCQNKSLKVNEVDFVAYYVSSFADEAQCAVVETLIKELPGVSAVKASFMSQRFAAVFYPNQCNKEKITKKLSEIENLTFKVDEFDKGKKSACPVHNNKFLKTIVDIF